MCTSGPLAQNYTLHPLTHPSIHHRAPIIKSLMTSIWPSLACEVIKHPSFHHVPAICLAAARFPVELVVSQFGQGKTSHHSFPIPSIGAKDRDGKGNPDLDEVAVLYAHVMEGSLPVGEACCADIVLRIHELLRKQN